MIAFLIILGVIFAVIAMAAPIVYSQTRNSFREQKNYERGLKIVPILIHLPPSSDDIQAGGRDIRDVTEETISKAQTIYNIIAGTVQKGFKSKFYGQRHFAFEIVGSQGFVYFYAAVPVALVEVVKQAIISAYPTTRLEEVAEHNIFSTVGKSNATLGGELSLKEPFAYPIATYQDLKRDTMQSLLNAMASLGKEDGAAIQILMRPADPEWRKTATGVASSKRKGNDKKLDGVGMLKNVATAFVKPPEDKGGSDKKHELSNLDQGILDSIDDKTRHAGFEVLIRVVASSNITQRSQAILSNIVASFSLYDAPGKNGFKYVPAKDTEALATSYIMRFFPQQNNKMVLNSVELATLFHFPDQRSIPTSQLSRQESKQVDGPRNVPEEGMLLGYNVFRGAKKPIRLAVGDRQRHMYVVGQTGTGKSTFLENLALQDMLNGNGFAFVDPHGDVVENLMAMVPKERTEDLIYFSPSEMEYPMGLNLFEFKTPDQKDFLIQETLNMLQKLYDPNQQGIMGSRYENIFRNAALAVMADPNGGTFVDIPKLFRDPQFLKNKLQFVTDQNVLDYWQKEYPASQRSNDSGEVTAWFVSKFGAFLSNEMMRNIIGQTTSAFDLRDIMDNKKILLVNLSKGRTGELNSKLLGMIFVMKFQAAAMSRSNIPESERIDFSLYVDEFQNFSTDSFATIMSEARKYRLNLIVANQFTTQLTQEIRDAVFGNMGTVVSFRIGQNDVESLGKYFQPTFDGDDLLRIPNYNTIVRSLIGGVPTQPFSMATLPALGTPNPQLSIALKQLSAAKFGRPKASVEKEIFARMATKEAPRPTTPTAPSPFGTAAPAQARPAAPAPKPAAGGSFLDDWLTKRNAPANGVMAAPAASAAPQAGPALQPQPQYAQTQFNQPQPAQPQPFAHQYQTPPQYAPAPSLQFAAPQPAQPQYAAPQPATYQQAPQQFSQAQAPYMTPTSDNQLVAAQNMPQPVSPPAPAEQPRPSGELKLAHEPSETDTKNISSDEIENNEVDKIANELRRQLKIESTPTIPVVKAPEPVTPAEPAPQPQPASTPPPAAPATPAQPGVNDTIFIDAEGKLQDTGATAVPNIRL